MKVEAPGDFPDFNHYGLLVFDKEGLEYHAFLEAKERAEKVKELFVKKVLCVPFRASRRGEVTTIKKSITAIRVVDTPLPNALSYDVDVRKIFEKDDISEEETKKISPIKKPKRK